MRAPAVVRADDVCEKIVEKGGFQALLEVASKQLNGGEAATLKATQALAIRTISYLAVNGAVGRALAPRGRGARPAHVRPTATRVPGLPAQSATRRASSRTSRAASTC